MKSFIDLAIGRTRTTLSLLVVVVFAGIVARGALPIANDPHIELPYFYIAVAHEGISPEDSERLLVQPMETELRKSLSSANARPANPAPATAGRSATP